MYERHGGPCPKGGLGEFNIAVSYKEGSSIVREPIQHFLITDGLNLKKSIHTVTNRLKQKLGATTSEIPAWQLYRE